MAQPRSPNFSPPPGTPGVGGGFDFGQLIKMIQASGLGQSNPQLIAALLGSQGPPPDGAQQGAGQSAFGTALSALQTPEAPAPPQALARAPSPIRPSQGQSFNPQMLQQILALLQQQTQGQGQIPTLGSLIQGGR